MMNRVEEVKKEVQEFSPEELATFRQRFAAFDAEVWDRLFEADVKAGKLDSRAGRALGDHAAGRSSKP